MRRRLFLPSALVLLLSLAGCLPAVLEDATPDAAVLAVPANEHIPGASDALHARLEELDTGHDLVGRAGVTFLEVRRGLVGSRIPAGAASVARTAGAEVAVTVGAARLDRELLRSGRAPRERVTLRLEAVLYRASDAAELARLSGPRTTGERSLDEDDALPPLSEDALVRELAARGVDHLAPRVADALRSLALNGSTGE